MTLGMLPQLIEKVAGLALERGGMNTALERFVTGRMTKLNLTRLEDYTALIADPAGPEQRLLIDAITVPHTWFFRDAEQLQTIAGILTEAAAGTLGVWVAGCASGEEAYTLSIIGRRIGRELNIVATDINEDALKAARRGVYSALAIRDVPVAEMRWFSEHEGGFAVDRALGSNIRFLRHNLVDPPPQPPTLRGGWDLVVCRNVLIYFSAGAAVRVLERFARSLRDGGSLVVGGSEVVFEPPAGLKLVASGTRLVLRRMSALPAAPPTPPTVFSAPPPRATSVPDPLSRRLGPATDPAIRIPSPVTDPAIRIPSPVTDPVIRIPSPATDPAIPRDPSPVRDESLVTALNRGHALFEAGEHVAAIAVFAELARQYPSVAEVWLFLGIARYVSGEAKTAATALRASLCLDPMMWPAGFYLARAYERLGRQADARQQYDLIAVDNPLVLQSSSAVINELRALRHDFRSAARRATVDRNPPQPPTWKPKK
jgi:chemotaxis methyl-accepting protein methylase